MPASEPKATTDTVGELKTMLVDYAKQETVTPLKGIGRYLAWGMAGSLLVTLGVIMLALAGLRALQTETGTNFTGNLSWLPYLIVLGGLLVVVLIAVKAIQGRKSA
ncbi:MAG: hypothetical protein U5K29_14220 [Acidimicrobiales bacterium]|nr:hypothetical protein [Acidimicrobiales bacterium]